MLMAPGSQQADRVGVTRAGIANHLLHNALGVRALPRL